MPFSVSQQSDDLDFWLSPENPPAESHIEEADKVSQLPSSELHSKEEVFDNLFRVFHM